MTCKQCLALQAEVARLTQEQERLRFYIQHKWPCALLGDGLGSVSVVPKDARCTCGLSAALASLPQEKK
jgi:hypothetical protein